MRPHITLLPVVLLLTAAFTARTATAQSGSAQRPMIEAHVWGGYTAFGGRSAATADSTSGEIGLRSAELAFWPTAAVRVFARYDNTLSLDNLALLQAGRRIPTWHGGAQLDWNARFTTVLDAGHRTLPGGISQTMIGGEQVVFVNHGAVVKAGGWVGPRSDQRTEWLAHAAINVPVGARTRVEPTLFFARSGVANDHQWRALLAGETRLTSRVLLGGGVAAGRNTSIDSRFTGAANSAYARITATVSGQQRVHLLLNRESAAGANSLTTIAAGFSLQVPRR